MISCLLVHSANSEELANESYKPFWEREAGDSRTARVMGCLFLLCGALISVLRTVLALRSPGVASEDKLAFVQILTFFDVVILVAYGGLMLYAWKKGELTLNGSKKSAFGTFQMAWLVANNEATRVRYIPNIFNQATCLVATGLMLWAGLWFVTMCIRQPFRVARAEPVSSG